MSAAACASHLPRLNNSPPSTRLGVSGLTGKKNLWKRWTSWPEDCNYMALCIMSMYFRINICKRQSASVVLILPTLHLDGVSLPPVRTSKGMAARH